MKNKKLINFIVLLLGLGALIFLVIEVGADELLNNLIAFGPAFPIIIAIEVFSNVTSCGGWYFCFEKEHRPRYFRLLGISFAALTVAGALPSGQAGEVAKGNLLRGHTTTPSIFSSLIIYNYFMQLTTLVVVVVAPIVAFATGDFGFNVTLGTFAVGFVMLAVTVLGAVLFDTGLLHKLAARLKGIKIFGKTLSSRMLDGIRDVDVQLKAALKNRRSDMVKGILGLLVGRLFQLLEVYVILHVMGISSSLVVALMVFGTTAIANYLLMVLPAREGFLEGSTFLVFRMLGMVGTDGLALEITRRLRKIAFQVFGVIMMFAMMQKTEPAKSDPEKLADEKLVDEKLVDE